MDVTLNPNVLVKNAGPKIHTMQIYFASNFLGSISYAAQFIPRFPRVSM